MCEKTSTSICPSEDDVKAEAVGVDESTIYRKIKRGRYTHRNSDWTEEERYSPDIAHEKYRENLQAKGPDLKIGNNQELADYIEKKISDHDFPLPELGKVSPYGVYVLNDNTGFVNLGISHDTPEFAGESVAHWWRCVGRNTFPDAKRLYITCDSVGSNGCRIWLWKHYVQELANETRMEIHVSHFPTGASKWNKVEHRLFCYISKNWQGHPLVDIETIVNLIGSTTTGKGLSVICFVISGLSHSSFILGPMKSAASACAGSGMSFLPYSLDKSHHLPSACDGIILPGKQSCG